ncbi:hypothetical protein VDG65_19360 [Xanthomonas campestris pv. raphani]|uniref:hypothetical protein n=1 Tax=Xanthomonas campestris TaxID=339 RepID=UPI00137ABD93|nr:hypothetical protein [Xanthomonas campestris]MEA9950870.1 hypothetical protein [Xanthomonas campestris pv. raphani]
MNQALLPRAGEGARRADGGKADKAKDQLCKCIDAIQKLGEDQGTQYVTQPQSHTFLQGEETMLSKAWSVVAFTVAAQTRARASVAAPPTLGANKPKVSVPCTQAHYLRRTGAATIGGTIPKAAAFSRIA